ncbi:MAG: metallophosphoesterase [Eubacteriales bacterium]|nr:metallophosphoesterase [Eubacteriales bacterium]
MTYVIWAIGILCAAALLVLAVMIADNHRFVVRHYEVASDRADRSYTFAFITDLHAKVYGKGNESILRAIREISPDAVLFGGDLIVAAQAGEEGDGWMKTALALLRDVSEEFPVFYVNGNHELKLDEHWWKETGGTGKSDGDSEAAWRRRRAFAGAYERLDRALAQIGVRPVRNKRFRFSGEKGAAAFAPLPLLGEFPDTEAAKTAMGGARVKTEPDSRGALADTEAEQSADGTGRAGTYDAPGIDVFGLELPAHFYTKFQSETLSVEEIDALIGRPDPARFTVLVTHTPKYFEAYAAWGADLVLCGHVHGGIARLPFVGGVLSPYPTLFPKYSGGHYELPGGRRESAGTEAADAGKEPRSVLVLSCGMGMHTLPVRCFNPAELSVITIKPQQ